MMFMMKHIFNLVTLGGGEATTTTNSSSTTISRASDPVSDDSSLLDGDNMYVPKRACTYYYIMHKNLNTV